MAARNRRRRAPAESNSNTEALQLDAQAVRYWRLQRGLTQQALSDQRASLDGQQQSISYAQIRRIEAGGRCGPSTARVLAALLSVEIAQLSPRDRRHLPCGLPREPSVDFVGRKSELKNVLAALESRGSVRIAASIEGLPGIGKTELALQVCGVCERERRFRVFWIDAQHSDLTSAWSDVVAPHLGIQATEPQQRVRTALQAIESLAEPVLLVLDNVDEWSASRPWPRPRGRHIRWLVTTRRSDLGGREFQHLNLPVLHRPAAEQLMLRVAGPEVLKRPGLTELLDLLGGYTLAVELAATFLRRFPDVSPDDYRGELECGQTALEEEVRDRTSYGHTLQRALDILWGRVPSRIRKHWQLAAAFAQAPASSALSDACGLDRRARAELRDFHLIEPHSKQTWSMHRLIREFARATASEEASSAFLQGCSTRAARIDGETAIEIYTLDRSHLDFALGSCPPGSLNRAFLMLLEKVGFARFALGEHVGACQPLEQALCIASNDAPRDAVVIARLRATLGRAQWACGDGPGAKALLESALKDCSEELGTDHTTVDEIRSALGEASQVLGDMHRARELFEEMLSSRALLGDAAGMARTKLRLGSVLVRLGDFVAAQPILEESLDWALLHMGEQHRNTQSRRFALSMCLMDQGDLLRAKDLLDTSLEHQRKILGEHHPDRMLSQGALGQALHRLGQLPQARDLLHKSLDSLRIAFSEEHPWIILTQNHLATTLMDLGDFAQARELLEHSVEVGGQQMSADHLQLAVYQTNLANLMIQVGEPERAQTLSEHALASCVRGFGENHLWVSGPSRSLAASLRALGKLEEARALNERAIDASLCLGDEHREVIQARTDLGALIGALGERVEALALLERAQDSALHSHGDQHPITSRIRLELARIRVDLGDLKSAHKLLELGIQAEHENQRGNCPLSGLLRALLAKVMHLGGHFDTAHSHAQEALRVTRSLSAARYAREQITELCKPILESPNSPD